MHTVLPYWYSIDTRSEIFGQRLSFFRILLMLLAPSVSFSVFDTTSCPNSLVNVGLLRTRYD